MLTFPQEVMKINWNNQYNLKEIQSTLEGCPLVVSIIGVLWLARWTVLSRQKNEHRVKSPSQMPSSSFTVPKQVNNGGGEIFPVSFS